ncbi:glutathione S-transferase family protein [Mesorhizobium sp. M1B.F.Ca.ET.045.04.1.1]|uniref:glutathione S-transferase family protein n=1 Tax=Mesorhizobium sp. M1B.F.Ca.ET.045.04.1.1 TaxID=2493673 RepID=UPI00167484AF|nr:glutathione S-transferase family protein [Mesorhizobium sp. M1B.F.Ca.ET.045.04.1.1]
MYLLYHYPYSQHSRRVVALLEEAGLEYELRHVALDQREQMSPAYLAINPNHQVPAMLDGSIKIFESNAILRYLCHKHRLSDWYPEDFARRAIVEQWLDWNQTHLAGAVIDIVLNAVFLGPRGDREAIARGRAQLAELAPILEAGVKDQAFLCGETPTIADLSVASNLTQLSLADAVPQQAGIDTWFKRVSAIEGVKRACAPIAQS